MKIMFLNVDLLMFYDQAMKKTLTSMAKDNMYDPYYMSLYESVLVELGIFQDVASEMLDHEYSIRGVLQELREMEMESSSESEVEPCGSGILSEIRRTKNKRQRLEQMNNRN